jgi:hypothetical protein
MKKDLANVVKFPKKTVKNASSAYAAGVGLRKEILKHKLTGGILSQITTVVKNHSESELKIFF